MGKFALVGLSGLAVNELLLFALTEFAGIYFVISGIAAVEASILTNFILNESWTFGDRKKGKFPARLAKYNSVALVGLAMNTALLYLLTVSGMHYLVSNVIAVMIVFLWNYFVNRRFTWRRERMPGDFQIGKDPLVSIIIPTYDEAENVPVLIPRIFAALEGAGMRGEVVVVDDNSPDGTADAAEKMSAKYPVRVVRRKGKLGLSSAVLEGLGHAEGGIIGVMDADLSHPPEAIPGMVKPITEGYADITIGSRYAGGEIIGWPLRRRVISRGASMLAKPLTRVTDPMSGFFFFNKSVIEGKTLNPTGYKIGLEIFVKGDARAKEVPYTFVDRRSGKSKLGRGEMVRYLLHLSRLYWHKINT